MKRADEAARDKVLEPWVKRAHDLVARRLADARAHSQTGAPEVARDRLREIQRGLLDAPRGSGGILRDARAELWNHALTGAAGDPRRVERLDDGGYAARTIAIDGRDEWAELGELLADAGRALPARLPEDLRSAAHAAWEGRHREVLSGWTTRTLSDAQMVLHHAVSRLVAEGLPA
jgi:hypothetical protein